MSEHAADGHPLVDEAARKLFQSAIDFVTALDGRRSGPLPP
jgi:hypothetical protein